MKCIQYVLLCGLALSSGMQATTAENLAERIILETAVGNAQGVQDFDSESLAVPALVGDHSRVGKAPTSASDSDAKDCADCAFQTAVSRIINWRLDEGYHKADDEVLTCSNQERFEIKSMLIMMFFAVPSSP